MPKRAKEMSAQAVRQLDRPGIHAVGGVAGLVLQVKDSGAKSWLLRTVVGGRRRAIGLGAFPDVGLSQAREDAKEMRRKIRNGVDPVIERQERRQALADANAARLTFDEAARQYIANKRHEFRNPKHVKQWQSTLNNYASPVIGNMPVSQITHTHIIQILEPIWTTKTETAARLRGRIENVLAWATTSGYRGGDNPARWRGHLDTVLAKPSKVAKVEHHPALPFTEVGAFTKALRQRKGMAARALEFLILTTTRSGEVRKATWDEIDLTEKVWTIPAERMKADTGRDHRVPLSDDAVRLLESLPRFENSPYVFAAPRGGPLTDMTISKVPKRMDETSINNEGPGFRDPTSGRVVVPHGFRSSFKDWASERTSYAHEVVEMALAHTIPSAVERAYRRGDLFTKRARLMSEWAKFCDTIQKKGNVTPIREKVEG